VPDRSLAIRVPIVTHERLDDEVIAINLETGIYYALVGTAADIWSAFDPAETVSAAVNALTQHYDAESEEVRATVEAFSRRLEAAGLLAECAAPAQAPAALPPLSPDSRWSPPELEEYRDMADLVLLDPIHQVDETGWPHLPEPQA
jgi:NAD(P)-dependent dehydrogenase (short-subunit alcohol dehydrogenase family)